MHRNASTSVFMIPELAELILLHLGRLDPRSWKQLFVVQRVNRTFRGLIGSSPELRRCMHLEPADPRRRPAACPSSCPDAAEIYRQFFFALEAVFYPFWPHVRAVPACHTIVVSLNVSMFAPEERAGAPARLHGSDPIERRASWRELLLPYHPPHAVELHCCGYDVMVRFGRRSTLGEIADQAIKAGRVHLAGMPRTRCGGQDSLS